MATFEKQVSCVAEALRDASKKYWADDASETGFRKNIDEILKILTPQQNEVIRLRYGFTDGQCHTPEEIGHSFGMTKERIHQIEAKALLEMRRQIPLERLK